jgi:chromosome segregation ATPase
MTQPLSSVPTPLKRALEQNESVKDSVEQSAAELMVINTVLKQEIPPDVQTGEVAQALEKTDALETRIQESAEDLAEVNEVLEQQIDERANLERELRAAKAALAKATGQAPGSGSPK